MQDLSRKNAIEEEKPEGIRPGKMVERQGTCKYCHQMQFVKAYPEDPQSEVDQLATDQCKCDTAKSEVKIKRAVFSLSRKLESSYSGMPADTRELLKGCLRPVAAQTVKKVTVSCMDGVSYTVFRKEGMLKILRSYTEQQEISEN